MMSSQVFHEDRNILVRVFFCWALSNRAQIQIIDNNGLQVDKLHSYFMAEQQDYR